ncbi:hypothetical protein [Williamsia sp. 1135]|uniref:hypothetical protein n=1 Tax=Williamsia sp. 1135 TaxID=1889262 RepID=UPI000A120ED8|nr:hypothetical protein [Williamsia sp. 1135]ORM36772.1 hypothetical protein BFL43_06095 [Williamsia sp. 1135]
MTTASATQRRQSSNTLNTVAVIVSALTALLAVAGAVGIAGGGIDFGDDIEGRLPWDSRLLAGLALVIIVAIPTALAAAALRARSPRGPAILIAAGMMLFGWIILQVIIIQAFNPLRVIFAVTGIALAITGLVLESRRERAVSRSDHTTTRHPTEGSNKR